ncbi:MAG: addiction module protein [Propionibacteriaceae bacterium]|jgi:hypothetical protein|nr:addiction module protein [Propionibacteriaceae bacterium]
MELTALVEAGRELAISDRWELAHQMLMSADQGLDDQLDWVEQAWSSELGHRIDDIENGRVEMVNGPETLQIARERVTRRRVGLAQ